MTRGNRCPFDTAVAVNLPQYRQETLKFELCDSLIATLQLITDNQQAQIITLENRLQTLQELNTAATAELDRKTKVNMDLFFEHQKLGIAYAKEKTWFKRNGRWVAFSAGIVAGSVATYYIVR